MAIALAIILGLLALAFVLYPVYRQRDVVLSVQAASGANLQEAEDASSQGSQGRQGTVPTEGELGARSALQEVELDYQLGNIGESEYRGLRERYMQQALVALKSRYEREQAIDEQIEEQLRRMKDDYEKADM